MSRRGGVTDEELSGFAARIVRSLSGKANMARKVTPPSVTLLSSRAMRRLTWKFLKERGVADVLAFPEPKHFPHPETRSKVLGEIYLNTEEAKRRPSRLLFLVIHGVLHLVGYDHLTRRDRMKMGYLEERLLKRFLGKD